MLTLILVLIVIDEKIVSLKVATWMNIFGWLLIVILVLSLNLSHGIDVGEGKTRASIGERHVGLHANLRERDEEGEER